MLEKVKLDQLTEICLSEMICQEINENKLKTNKQFKKGWQGDRQNQNSRCWLLKLGDGYIGAYQSSLSIFMHIENFQNKKFIHTHTHIYTHTYNNYIHNMHIYIYLCVYMLYTCMCVCTCYICIYTCCISAIYIYIKQCSLSPVRPGFTDQPHAWPPCLEERSMELPHLLHLSGLWRGSIELGEDKGHAGGIPEP